MPLLFGAMPGEAQENRSTPDRIDDREQRRIDQQKGIQHFSHAANGRTSGENQPVLGAGRILG
jgi:hypothetical protein